jgi:hypothetical protein
VAQPTYLFSFAEFGRLNLNPLYGSVRVWAEELIERVAALLDVLEVFRWLGADPAKGRS